MDDLATKLAMRDRYLRKLALAKSPEERMRDMAALQARMWATMRSSPAGYAHFLRRNFKARAVKIDLNGGDGSTQTRDPLPTHQATGACGADGVVRQAGR
jgi:hypothetical protein